MTERVKCQEAMTNGRSARGYQHSSSRTFFDRQGAKRRRVWERAEVENSLADCFENYFYNLMDIDDGCMDEWWAEYDRQNAPYLGRWL